MKIAPKILNRFFRISSVLLLAVILGCSGGAQQENSESDDLDDELYSEVETEEEDGDIVNPQNVAGSFLTGQLKSPDGRPVTDADVYFYGYPGGRVNSDDNGRFNIPVPKDANPKEKLIAIKSGESLGVLSELIDLTNSGNLDLNLQPTGSLSGNVKLFPSIEDQAGIDVYIPGTTFIAKSNKEGAFAFPAIPGGSWNLRADFDGYFSAEKEVLVVSNIENVSEDLELFLSIGPSFSIELNNGSAHTLSPSIEFKANYSPNTVLMKISNGEPIAQMKWGPVAKSGSINLPNEGKNIITVQFADRNGLESDTKEIIIYLNDNDGDGVLNSVDCDPDNDLVFQMESFNFRDSDGDAYFVSETGTVCSGLTLPLGYKSSLGIGEQQDCAPDDPEKFKSYSNAVIDSDGDGYYKALTGDFCAGDSLPLGYAESIPDNSFADCDDENANLAKQISGYEDTDGDNYGVGAFQELCKAADFSSNLGENPDDCDPSDPTKFIAVTGYQDTDSDGYGAGSATEFCNSTGNLDSGYVNNDQDLVPNDANHNLVESWGLIGGDSGRENPLVAMASDGSFFVLNRARTSFDADFSNISSLAPVGANSSDDIGFLLKYDSNQALEFNLSVANPGFSGGGLLDGNQLDFQDMKVGEDGHLYIAGTVMEIGGYPADFDFRADQVTDPSITAETRYLFLMKVNGTTGATFWYKLVEVEVDSATAAVDAIDETNAKDIRLDIEGGSLNRVVVGGTAYGYLDTNNNASVDAGDPKGDGVAFAISYELDGTLDKTYSTSGRFADIEIASNGDIYLLHAGGINKYTAGNSEAIGPTFTGTPDELEIDADYVYYSYLTGSGGSHSLELRRIDIADFSTSKQLKVDFAYTTANLELWRDRSYMIKKSGGNLYLQLSGKGQFTYSIAAGGDQNLSYNLLSTQINHFMLEFSSESAGFAFQNEFEMGTNFDLSQRFMLNPEGKYLIPFRLIEDSFQMPWMGTSKTFYNSTRVNSPANQHDELMFIEF